MTMDGVAYTRPTPDALLIEAAREEARKQRGKLKVFFGMAAGVGKTYAMLEEARARAAEGQDVLVGYAEPHIRTQTEALLLGMEILPYKLVAYRNTQIKEFDLDAALKRRPALLCVDELAHTNAPGMRHPKRWQDVMELLDAGINVYTTLNVQHLESVNDIVERVTGIKVRETLPDSMLEQADEVELVDIAPEELLERLREGKVYRPDQAEQATRNFFSKGNLIALRELALRQTAQRVDAQMDDFRRDNAVGTIWAATERIIVCVGPSPLSARLVRAAKRLSARLKAQWIAVHVETLTPAGEAERRRVDENLRLAEQLGAETIRLRGHRVSDEILAYAARRNATKIVIGKPMRSRWREMLMGSVVDELVRNSGDVDIYVIRGGATDGGGAAKARIAPTKFDWGGYAWATALSAIATAIGWPLNHTLGLANTNILMLYLLVVLWVASRESRGAAIFASVLGVALFDFCFVPPFLAFSVSDQQYVVTFAVMLATALLISTLTHLLRGQGEAARDRERRTATMLSLSRDLAVARGTMEAGEATLRHMSDILGSRAVLLLPDEHRHVVARLASSGEPELSEKEISVAQWAFDREQSAGAGTNTLPAASALYLPLKSARGAVGVVGIFAGAGEGILGPERQQLAEALAAQAALAIERGLLVEEARQAAERVEAEFLRNTLLSGVSHELRTPLAAITGASSALIEAGLPPEARSEMLETIYVEAERMERLISNLLDMTRMESGGLVLQREWQPLQEVVGSALRHLDRRLGKRPVKMDISPELPLIRIDTVAIEQVLANLIENAIEYTPAESTIEIRGRVEEGAVVVEVADRGPGLPEGMEQKIFEKFFRIHPAQSPRGIGLGLAIARGIVEAHSGVITAANRHGGGAVFRFTIPVKEAPPLMNTGP